MSKLVLLLTGFCVAVAGGLVWGLYSFVRHEFPDLAQLKNQYPVIRYQGPDEDVEVHFSRSKPESWVQLGLISKQAVGAIVVSEDWAFYQHKGYDANQIREAIHEDWEAGGFVRGASTITQQVVKNVFLEKDKNLWRKLKELFLATRLESVVGKRKILETYLNIAEWGEGIYGISAASRKYFGKSPLELTAKEGAFLAMLLPSPKRYAQSFKNRKLTEYADKTVRSILNKMVQAKYITEEERVSEEARPLSFEDGLAPVIDEPVNEMTI